jgi:hypothetical protein
MIDQLNFLTGISHELIDFRKALEDLKTDVTLLNQF